MHEKRHRIALLILLIICFGVSIYGVAISILDFMALTKSGIFEALLIIIANFFMVGIVVFASVNTINSFKHGSTFMKELTMDSRKNIKTKSIILYFIVTIIGITFNIVFILMISDVLYNKVFPKGLDAAMISFTLIIITLGISFMAYPYAVKKDLNKTSN